MWQLMAGFGLCGCCRRAELWYSFQVTPTPAGERTQMSWDIMVEVRRHRGPDPAPLPQEKVSQLKDEVRLQYEKMHQILDEDLRKTMEILDKAQAKFCNENAAQVLHLNERMQEAKKLLSSVQVMFDKTEDINFMKVRQAACARGGMGAVGKPGCVGSIGEAWDIARSRLGTLAAEPEGSAVGEVKEEWGRLSTSLE